MINAEEKQPEIKFGEDGSCHVFRGGSNSHTTRGTIQVPCCEKVVTKA